MKMTAKVKLLPTPEQAAQIINTMRAFRLAANRAAALGFAAKAFQRASLHRAAYRVIRTEMPESSALACVALKAVVSVFRRDRTCRPIFTANVLPFDKDSLTFWGSTVSVRVGPSRLRIPFVCGVQQSAMLATRTKSADLIHRDGQFFLHVACNVAEASPIAVTDYIGVDLGVANLATTSDGQQFTGEQVEQVRVRHADRRRRLNREATRQQRKGRRPKNVRRALKRLGKRESLYRRDVNHCITKQVVALAEGTKRGIAVEDLTGIRARIRFAKPQRAKMGGWAFAQWQAFCAYKAQRAGVPYVVVNPAYTSQTCHACAVIDKASRLDQARFVCTACGHTAHADVNAAQNIAARAHVEAPMVAESPQEIAA